MRISSINGFYSQSTILQKRKNIKNAIFAENPIETPEKPTPISNPPAGYINFKGRTNVSNLKEKMEFIENETDFHGKKLIDEAKKLAKKYNLKEITQPVVLLAGLIGINKYIDELNSGEKSYDDVSTYSLPETIENETANNIFKTKEKRGIIKPVIEKEIKVLEEYLGKNETKIDSKDKKKEIFFSIDFLNDIYSNYQKDNQEDSIGRYHDELVHDGIIFESAFYPSNDNIAKTIITPFRTDLKNATYVDRQEVGKMLHIPFYDEKAKSIWQNISNNKNTTILTKNDVNPKYLITSILRVFENNSSSEKLNKDNTQIIRLKNEDNIDEFYIRLLLNKFKKTPDKNYVMIMPITEKNSDTLSIDVDNVECFQDAPKNVHFIMIADNDIYYRDANDPELNGFFDNFGTVSMPLLDATQTKKMFKEQPKLLEKIEKTFSKQAINKCIDAAKQLKGNYPEKALQVMEMVSSHYINEKEVTLPLVETYIKNNKDFFNSIEDNDDSIKIILDVNTKIKDLIGKPSTKKEATAIAQSIKNKSFGTKGYMVYSQDGSVGAGRKYTIKAIAGETNSPYFEINAGDFGTEKVSVLASLFGGKSLTPEEAMKKLFGTVKAQAESSPNKSAVLCIEDFEYFSNGEMISEFHQKAMTQLIREMDKAQEKGLNIAVFGLMSNPDMIGNITKKSFKFIDELVIESPSANQEAIMEIINTGLRKKNIKLEGDITQQEAIKQHIVDLQNDSSFIEIYTLLDKAKSVAQERKHKRIQKKDFTEAFLQIYYGRPLSLTYPGIDNEKTASHECGHALNNIIMENLPLNRSLANTTHYKLNFLTLDARTDHGGATFSTPTNIMHYPFEYAFGSIIHTLGGNSAEKIIWKQDGSNGIHGDIESTTHLAQVITATMGMGKNLGKKSLGGMNINLLSEKDKDLLNKDIEIILNNAQVVSDAITEVYADFNKEFSKKYTPLIGTGDAIIYREEFLKDLDEWKAKQSPEKQKEFDELNKAILAVIEATKKGIKCSREE